MKKLLITILGTILLVSMSTTNIFAEDADAKNITTGVSYATLQDAINAVNNSEEIIVIDDIICGTPITINNGKTFTIDFINGSESHTFTWDVTSGSTINQNIFTIDDNSNVTVENMIFLVGGTEEQHNTIFNVNASGLLKLSNMTLSDGNQSRNIPVVNTGGTVIINGGTITTNQTNHDSISPHALNPIVQNLGGTTTFTGNGIYTMKNVNTGAAWLGNVITTPDPDADTDTNCGTVIIENGTFNTGHIVVVNGKGNVTINNAIYNTGNGPIIKTFHGGIKSNITINNITASVTVFAQVIEELVTKINFQNGNVKYTPSKFCINQSGDPMTLSVSIKNGKFGPKTGITDIHDEINNLLATGATLTALTGDPNYTYKVETHNHLFTYTASNNKISATCITGCDKGYDTTPLTLTLTAPSSLVYDGNVKEFTFADGETNAWTEATLAPPAITYEAKPGSSLTNDKAVNVGSYTASITVDTDKTASFDFEITNATPTPTPDPDPTPRYKIPNTGVEGMPTNNHSLLKLSSLSLLAVGTYLVIKKKKDN